MSHRKTTSLIIPLVAVQIGCAIRVDDLRYSNVVMAESTTELLVQFESGTNLAEVMAEKSVNVGAYPYFCERPRSNALIGGPTVFWKGSPLLPDVAQDIAATLSASNTATYMVRLSLSRRETLPSIPPRTSFDLRAQPESVCFDLKGGNVAGVQLRTNVVAVPAEDLRAAIR